MGVRHDLGADLGQMLVHRFRVRGRHDDGRSDPRGRAYGAEQIGGVMAIVAYHDRTGTDWRPNVGVRSLLPDPGFVLNPNFDRRPMRAAEQNFLQQGAEVFLYSSCTAAFFLG